MSLRSALFAAALVTAHAGEVPEFKHLSGTTAPEWQPLYQGVDYRIDELEAPRRLRIHQIRIDTQAEGITFFTTPDNGDAPREVNGRRTSTFLKEFELEVAINGTGFEPIASEGSPVDILGLSISDGKKVSGLDVASRNPIFLVDRANRASILRASLEEAAFAAAHNALQGWYGANGMLLDDGERVTITKDIHPRTALGISRDGQHVYFLVADGRQPGFSEGLTLIEMAEWMKQQLGCWDAMNLDGGGSSTLVVKNADATPRIVNKPSGGVQRSVANHLGVQALPLAVEP